MPQPQRWNSRLGLILAMAGNAVGLGNFLRFPVQAIQNGGGAFIIPYLICFLLLGIPLLWVEWSMGRLGGKNGHHSSPYIFQMMGKHPIWKYLGAIGLFGNLCCAAYYCYIESWTLSYVGYSLQGVFHTMTQEDVSAHFDAYIMGNRTIPILAWLACILLNMWIIGKSIGAGIEKLAKIAMPALILFAAFLAIKGISIEKGVEGAMFDGSVGLNFLWTPHFDSLLNPKVWLAAAGQIFFTLSLGIGSIQCYASFVRENEDISLNALSAGWLNEFVEVVLGSAILIPISIGYLGIDKVVEMTRTGAMGLGFKVLPYLFQQWGQTTSIVAGSFWFALLFFAGITSSVAMGVPVISFLEYEGKWKRQNAAYLWAGLVFLIGLPVVLLFQYGVMDEFDYWLGTVSLVVFALMEIILFAWIFGVEKGWDELNRGAEVRAPRFFMYITKYVTPVLLIFILVGSLFSPEDLPTSPKPEKISTNTKHLPSDTLQIADSSYQNAWTAAYDSLQIRNKWPFHNQSLVGVITHKAIYEQIQVAKTAEELSFLNSSISYKNATRVVLLILLALVLAVVKKVDTLKQSSPVEAEIPADTENEDS